MTSLSVLIVIPCLNEAAHLPGLLKQLESEDLPWPHRIVVADGGSSDGSRAIVSAAAERSNAVILLPNPDKLQSAGINAAVDRYGEGCDYLVRMDAHAVYPTGFVQGLVATATARQADSVVVPMRTVGGNCFQTGAATAQNSAIGTGGAAHRIGGKSGWVDHGHHALMKVEAFRGVGGYDPRFSHNEDAELDLRLAQNGYRLWMDQSLSLDYVPRSAAGPLYRQYANYGRGRARTVRLHGERLKVRQALPLAVAPAVACLMAGLLLTVIHPIFLGLTLPAVIWASACLLAGTIAARRVGGVCALGAGPIAMLMHLGWSVGFWREWLAGRRLETRPIPSV